VDYNWRDLGFDWQFGGGKEELCGDKNIGEN